MSNRILSGALVALLSFAAFDRAVPAATIDTFEFTDSIGWAPFAATISLTFTGEVEPDGLIEQADLSNFTASVLLKFNGNGLPPIAIGPVSVGPVSFFSFNPGAEQGGSSSLDLIAALGAPLSPPALICLGAVAALSQTCDPEGLVPGMERLDGITPAAQVGLIIVQAFFVTATPDFPVITRVSSVTTIPEAPTWAMLLAGFAGLGFAGYRAQRGSAAARIGG